MANWPADNQSELIAFYGNPGAKGRAGVGAQLVKVTPPFQMYYDGKPLKTLSFHKKAAPALVAALEEIWEHYGKDQAVIDRLGISSCAGTYNPRFVRGSTSKWSNHAYGAAIDLNASQNGFGKGKGNIPLPVIAAFKRQGARWGGDYKGRTDPMHFEFCSAAGYGQPLGIASMPHADGDTDSDDKTSVVSADGDNNTNTQEMEDSAERDTETRGSWISRKWRSLTGWFSGGSALGVLGYLTDPWVVVAIFGALVVVVVLFVLFMGPSDVRAWIRKQVS